MPPARRVVKPDPPAASAASSRSRRVWGIANPMLPERDEQPASMQNPSPSRVLTPRRAAPADSVRPTRAEISLEHLRHNLTELARAAQVPVWSVLKADAYGHGAKAVARTLERAGAKGVCVALIEEGIELREAGIVVPILVMGGHYQN